MSAMTEAEFLARIEQMEAEREAADAARRAAITPHVLRAAKRQPGRMSGPRYFNLMRAIEADPVAYADYLPTTYCGAPRTTEDIDRRGALSWLRKDPAAVAERGVCTECLALAQEGAR